MGARGIFDRGFCDLTAYQFDSRSAARVPHSRIAFTNLSSKGLLETMPVGATVRRGAYCAAFVARSRFVACVGELSRYRWCGLFGHPVRGFPPVRKRDFDSPGVPRDSASSRSSSPPYSVKTSLLLLDTQSKSTRPNLVSLYICDAQAYMSKPQQAKGKITGQISLRAILTITAPAHDKSSVKYCRSRRPGGWS